MAEIDLDALARGYRHRPSSEAALARADREAVGARLGPGRVAVDIGGGRGEHAARFAATGASALVVDRSARMAGAARRHPGVDAVVGDSVRLPVRSGSAHLAYFHVSLHHGDWRRALAEAVRALGGGGTVVVWTFSGRHFDASFLTRWFPSVGEIDRARFPLPGDIASHLEVLGCGAVTVSEEREEVHRSAGSWAAAAAGGFVSTLQMLPAGELEAGLRRFREEHPDPDEELEYLLDYRRIAGTAPQR